MKEKIKIKRTVTYEIEVIDTDKPIPKEQEIDFIEWLSSMTSECTTGRNHEHYSYTDNYNDDIGVTFYIKTI